MRLVKQGSEEAVTFREIVSRVLICVEVAFGFSLVAQLVRCKERSCTMFVAHAPTDRKLLRKYSIFVYVSQ